MGSVARVTSAAEGLPRRRFTITEVEAMETSSRLAPEAFALRLDELDLS
jgi:hypothetical protein